MDVGASRIRGGGVTASVPSVDLPTPAAPEDIVAAVVAVAAYVVMADAPSTPFLGVSCAGLVDYEGCVSSLHLSFDRFPLKAELERETGLAVHVVNDAHAQALGCARPDETLCFFTIGTGVGGCIVAPGRTVLRGANGFAGEFGHIPVDLDGRACPCGRRGCLDTVAAGVTLTRQLGDGWWSRTGPDVVRTIRAAASGAARAAAMLITLTDPSRIVFAGHLPAQPAFATEFDRALSQSALWAKPPVEFIPTTWPSTCRGLPLLLRDETPTRTEGEP